MNSKVLIFSSVMMFSVAVLPVKAEQTENDNPFFREYNTPYGVPPFDEIKLEHYMPAFEAGMMQQTAEIDHIVTNRELPTFENTILALEYSGELLTKVARVFYNLNGSNTNAEMQALARELSPKTSAHSSSIILNEQLFHKVNEVYKNRHELGLNAEQMRLVEEKHKGFVRGGALLQGDQRERLRDINTRMSQLTLNFGQNVLAETNSFELLITEEHDLQGLPRDLVENAAAAAERRGHDGAWVFTLHNPSVEPFLQYSSNRELRQKIWRAYVNRGNNGNENDNNDIIAQLVKLRAERAALLGYSTHAHFVLEESMAKTPENVMELLERLWEPATARAKEEAAMMNRMVAFEGNSFRVEAWDWRYYAEKIRSQQFDLDDEALRAHFSLNDALQGMFEITEKLWGIQMRELHDVPKYHEDVMVYEALEADGRHIGIIYFDLYNRDSKRGGAWMSVFRGQSIDREGNFVHPVVVNVCNFPAPTDDIPSLLTMDQVTTLFHEFGHGLHGLLSNVTFPSMAGTSVPRDFVELPSQLLENWSRDPRVIPTYARHYQTGEPIPAELIEKMEASKYFNQGFATTEYLASSFLDMYYHNTPAKEINLTNIADFETRFLHGMGMPKEIVARHRSTYFNHVFSGGYSAGYYSYIWSAILDADAYEAFNETGDLYNPEVAKKLRTYILEPGGTEDPQVLYRKFRGAEPAIEPLLKRRGLLPEDSRP
jgi:peptidyl-dipeptidase Dcp